MNRFTCLSLMLALVLLGGCKKTEQTAVEAPAQPAGNQLQTFQDAAAVDEDAELIQAFPVDSLPPLSKPEELSGSIDANKNMPSGQEINVTVPIRTTLDTGVSADGKGALKIASYTPGKKVVPMYVVKSVNTGERRRLAYRALVSTGDIRGQAYLQLAVKLAGEETPAISENRVQAIRSATSPQWVQLETAYFIPPGKTVEEARLNFVLDGLGTAWIDDLKLYKTPTPFDPNQVDPEHPRQ